MKRTTMVLGVLVVVRCGRPRWPAEPDVTTLPDAAPDMLSKAPTWKPAGRGETSRPKSWRGWKRSKPAEAVRAKAAALWANLPEPACGDELLDRLVGDRSPWPTPNAAKLVELCSKPRSQLKLPSQPWLQDPKLAALGRPPISASSTAGGWCSSRCSTRPWSNSPG